MKILLTAIMLIPMIGQALPVKVGEKFRVQIPGEFIIKTQGEKVQSEVLRKLGKNIFLIKANSQKELLNYQTVYPNYAYFGDYKESVNTPNDIGFSQQNHHNLIQTTKAWATTKGNSDIIIAVTDNEFQINHPDLQTAWWKNVNEIPDNGIDDDNNGYIDDVFGWDFMGEDNNVDSDKDPTHGTHIAGIIAATANNQIGVVGIAPQVKVMPLRWYGDEQPWTSAMIAETYRYAVDNGAKIITTSYGIDHLVDDEAYLDAISYIRQSDVILFNSAGNNGVENPPRQALEDVILVCSVKTKKGWFAKEDQKSSFSNYGTGIDICAPGDPIYSTVQQSQGSEGAYADLKGTSMAAPAAAAVAALIWSAHPNFSDEDVIQRLYDSADNIDAVNRKYIGLLGAGRINAYKAVK